MKYKRIAIVGAGIYGTSIAIKLAQKGMSPTIYDPLGVMNAASAINQLRVHKGYHYPRSSDTIKETLNARDEFISQYREALVSNVESFYAIPHKGSLTSVEQFEGVCKRHFLEIEEVRPEWVDYSFIKRCYLVDEELYDPKVLKGLIIDRLRENHITVLTKRFEPADEASYDRVVYATYGTSGGHKSLFDSVKFQVAEKVLIRLPAELSKKSLVIIDGPFTAFDPFGNSEYSQFGSAKHTNHWSTTDPLMRVPQKYSNLFNKTTFEKIDFTNFSRMRDEAVSAVPLAEKAEYIGSKFTLRVVENNPSTDRRILRISQPDEKVIHVFSGKVVSAVKAARLISELI